MSRIESEMNPRFAAHAQKSRHSMRIGHVTSKYDPTSRHSTSHVTSQHILRHVSACPASRHSTSHVTSQHIPCHVTSHLTSRLSMPYVTSQHALRHVSACPTSCHSTS
eukprot:2340025-Rhodomonas_salina.1